jgi:hypothetical protein
MSKRKSRRKRATVKTDMDCPQEFIDLLKQTVDQSDHMTMEFDQSDDGLTVYETGPFRDVALNNLPFGPLADDADVADDGGIYAECHIIRADDEAAYMGVWHYGSGAAWAESKPDFVLKSGQGGESDRIELTAQQADHIVKEHGGWDYVE